jgi:hypothetical protein
MNGFGNVRYWHKADMARCRLMSAWGVNWTLNSEPRLGGPRLAEQVGQLGKVDCYPARLVLGEQLGR